MRRIHRKVVQLGVVLAGLGGCSALGIEPPEAPEGVVSAVGNTFLRSPIQGVGGATGVSGEVELVDLPQTDDMQVQVDVSGISPGAHAWHIHSGTCAQLGGIVVPFTTAGPNQGIDEAIQVAANGRGEADARLPADRLSRQQIENGDYALNIHANATGGPGVACANL